MFIIEYKISKRSYNDFIGEMGYYQIKCNDKIYGDIYPDELEDIMGTEYLYDWFEKLLKITIELNEKDYVALDEIESPTVWLEFEKQQNKILISVVKSEKQSGVGFIVYSLKEKHYDENLLNKEEVIYKEFIWEILVKSNEYLQELKQLNTKEENIEKTKKIHNLSLKLEEINKIYELQ